MSPSTLLIAVLACPLSAAAAPVPLPVPRPAPSGAADQKLIDRYTDALRAKYGSSRWALENGALTAESPAGKITVDVSDARGEDDVEAKILAALKPARSESGDAKIPVYFVGVSADELFRGAVAAGDAPAAAADLAAKAEGNEFKALLDLRQGKISFPGHTQPEIVFKINEKAPRRVVVRRAEDGSLAVTLDGDDYAFVTARVLAGGKSERAPVKAGPASVFFEMNVWMQKTQKAADGRAALEKPRKLSDGGYRHPAFERLMAQVQSGLNSENLDKAFENAGAHAPANLEARAQAARELAASGYGGAARWKINSNGKYADAHGNLTLMVRTGGPAAPGGKIEETPVLIKRNASGGYDLAAAVGPVTRLLLDGQAVAARAKAYETAAAATPKEVAAEVAKAPASSLTGPGTLGFTGTTQLRNVRADAPVPDAAVARVVERRETAVAAEKADVLAACGGKTDCAPSGPVVRAEPAMAPVALPAKRENVACTISMEISPEQKYANEHSEETLPAWAVAPPQFGGDQKSGDVYATAADCAFGIGNRGLERSVVEMRARARLARLVGCTPSGTAAAVTLEGSRPSQFAHVRTKDGQSGICAEIRMKVHG